MSACFEKRKTVCPSILISMMLLQCLVPLHQLLPWMLCKNAPGEGVLLCQHTSMSPYIFIIFLSRFMKRHQRRARLCKISISLISYRHTCLICQVFSIQPSRTSHAFVFVIKCPCETFFYVASLPCFPFPSFPKISLPAAVSREPLHTCCLQFSCFVFISVLFFFVFIFVPQEK